MQDDEAAPARGPVHISSETARLLLARRVQPKYPPEAREKHIQGVVLFKAEINKAGNVKNLTLISGHPLLAGAASDAVKQWVYKPYVLDGHPVDVDTEIQVDFHIPEK